MHRILFALAALSGIAAGPHGDLWRPAYVQDHALRGPTRPYEPQVGDIVFLNYEDSFFWKIGFKMAFAGPPDHSGVVAAMPDGTLAVLESGPDDTLKVEVCSLDERLKFHHCNRGRLWIRRRLQPLTADESARLTQFAISERGKDYALWRMLGQGTWLRSRGPVRTQWMGKPKGPHDSYFCSEVVLEALVWSGVLDWETTRPAATYPEDFFYDRSRNRYVNQHLNLACRWEPPARLTFEDCPACKAPKGTHSTPVPGAIPTHPHFNR